MYIFKTCAAICENFVRESQRIFKSVQELLATDLLTFIHSNWKRTIKTPDFFNILSTFCHQFFKNSPKICPNREPFVNREPFSAGFSRLLNGFPPPWGEPQFRPQRAHFCGERFKPISQFQPSPPAKMQKDLEKFTHFF